MGTISLSAWTVPGGDGRVANTAAPHYARLKADAACRPHKRGLPAARNEEIPAIRAELPAKGGNFGAEGGLGWLSGGHHVNLPGFGPIFSAEAGGDVCREGVCVTGRNRTSHDRAELESGINVATLDMADVLVTDSTGSTLPITSMTKSATTNGTPRTGTYQIGAPGGSWDLADNGTYTVALQAAQVSDINGNQAAARTLGTFTVNLETTPPQAALTAANVTSGAGRATASR